MREMAYLMAFTGLLFSGCETDKTKPHYGFSYIRSCINNADNSLAIQTCYEKFKIKEDLYTSLNQDEHGCLYDSTYTESVELCMREANARFGEEDRAIYIYPFEKKVAQNTLDYCPLSIINVERGRREIVQVLCRDLEKAENINNNELLKRIDTLDQKVNKTNKRQDNSIDDLDHKIDKLKPPIKGDPK